MTVSMSILKSLRKIKLAQLTSFWFLSHEKINVKDILKIKVFFSSLGPKRLPFIAFDNYGRYLNG